jgi:hypothetical protein
MSEIIPPSLINSYFFNNREPEPFCPKIEKKPDSKIQDVVLSCITKSSPSGLFVSAIAPDVVFILELDRQGKMRKRRDWNKKNPQ